MCNLYDLDVAPAFLKDRFRLRRVPEAGAGGQSGASAMIRPSVRAPVIHLDADGEHVCSLMEWGFVRQWKNEAGKPTLRLDKLISILDVLGLAVRIETEVP